MYNETAAIAAYARASVQQDVLAWPESDEALRHFGERFLARAVTRQEWNHAAHLACAVYFIMMRADLSAEVAMAAAIRAHNDAVGTPNDGNGGYHATITLASLAVTRSFCWRYPEGTSPAALARALIRSRFGDRCWLDAHWSRQSLWSVTARRRWVAPDLEPLPATVLLPGLTILAGDVPGAASEVRTLFGEYEAAWGRPRDDANDVGAGTGAHASAALPGVYAPPLGMLYLAYVDGALAGCCAMRPLGEGACEMQRLWVRPRYRNRGVAQLLVSETVDAARRAGHDRMVLEILPPMEVARRLFQRLGFAPVKAFNMPASHERISLGRPIARSMESAIERGAYP